MIYHTIEDFYNSLGNSRAKLDNDFKEFCFEPRNDPFLFKGKRITLDEKRYIQVRLQGQKHTSLIPYDELFSNLKFENGIFIKN